MSMPNDPFADGRMAQILSGKFRISDSASNSDTKAAGATEPTVLTFADQRAAFYVAAATVDNVPHLDPISFQALRIIF
jgi:hypothetical protein